MKSLVEDKTVVFQNFSSLQFIDYQKEWLEELGVFQNFSSLQFMEIVKAIDIAYIHFKTFQVYSS